MDIKEIIYKKAKGGALTKGEIDFFVGGYTKGEIADYQISALLMAIKINGMSERETFWLTDAMLHSGDVIDLSDLGDVVDKHSTGGVSDTTTLAVVPICAACGVKMLKMSGGGLGHTGGTIDKLKSFDGFNTNINIDEAKNLVKEVGACIISASKDLAPADKKLYALRNVTATVESSPLIASSIMSKKLASGANAIVLDVKYGNGAFMKTKKDALNLARLMVKIGEAAGKRMDYVIGGMNEPLGYCIGNKLEAHEAIEVIKGEPSKLRDAVLEISAKCIALGKNVPYQKAYEQVSEAIDSGRALLKFKEIVKAQGGSLNLFRGLGLKPVLLVKSETAGTLRAIDCVALGTLVGQMGANKQKIDDVIDVNVGVRTKHKIGDEIKAGDVIFEIYAKNKAQAKEFAPKFVDCYKIEGRK